MSEFKSIITFWNQRNGKHEVHTAFSEYEIIFLYKRYLELQSGDDKGYWKAFINIHNSKHELAGGMLLCQE